MKEHRDLVENSPKSVDRSSAWMTDLPMIRKIDDSPSNKVSLIEATNSHLEKDHYLRERAEKLGHDIAAFSTEHGKVLVIGAGVTTLALGAISFIIYQRIHRHSDGKEE